MEGERRRFARRIAKVGIAAFVWAVVLVGVAVVGGNAKWVGMFALGWLFLAPPAAAGGVLWARDGWRRARALGMDLAGCRVELLSNGGGGDEGTKADVLPFSGMILSVDGEAIGNWVTAPVRDVAGPPASAWLSYFSSKTEVDRTRERAMTEDERTELVTLVRSAGSVPQTAWMMAVPVAGFLLAVQLGAATGVLRDLSVFVAGIGALGIVLQVGASLLNARALREDLRLSTMCVAAFSEEKQGAGYPVSIEYLPSSLRVWTIEGRPAPWRLTFDGSDLS